MAKAVRRRKRLMIQTPVDTTPTGASASGVATRTYTDLVQINAEVLPQGGREFFRAMQVHATVTHLFRTRWSPDVSTVTPRNRIIGEQDFEGRTFEIVAAINEDERDRTLLLTCVEDVPNG